MHCALYYLGLTLTSSGTTQCLAICVKSSSSIQFCDIVSQASDVLISNSYPCSLYMIKNFLNLQPLFCVHLVETALKSIGHCITFCSRELELVCMKCGLITSHQIDYPDSQTRYVKIICNLPVKLRYILVLQDD